MSSLKFTRLLALSVGGGHLKKKKNTETIYQAQQGFFSRNLSRIKAKTGLTFGAKYEIGNYCYQINYKMNIYMLCVTDEYRVALRQSYASKHYYNVIESFLFSLLHFIYLH